jgi:GntR family transcriptional regulator
MAATVLYAQTADALRKRIGEGWQVGDRIPAEPKLCEEFGVSSITMRRAVGTLVAEGLLVRLQGKGTFVSADHAIVQGPPDLTSFTQDMVTRGWGSTSRVVGITIGPGSADTSLRLGVSAGAALTRIERVRLADGLPIAIQIAYLPSIAFPSLERFDFGRDSLYDVLRIHYGVKASAATETYRASTATAPEASMLEVEPGSPVFRAKRLTVDSLGNHIELVESVIRGDRYTLQLRLSASHRPSR